MIFDLVYFQLTFSACPIVYISLLCSGSLKPFHQSAPQSCQRSHSGPLVTKFDHWTLSHPFFFCVPCLFHLLPCAQPAQLSAQHPAEHFRFSRNFMNQESQLSHPCTAALLYQLWFTAALCQRTELFRVFRKYFYLVTNGATTSSKRLKCAYSTRASTAKSDNRRHNVIVVNKTQGRRSGARTPRTFISW